MNTTRRRILLFVLLALGATASRAKGMQADSHGLPQLRRNWTIDDGLPQNSVTCMVEARDGYLWLGTFGGLVRFDGDSFTVFELSKSPELGSNRITSLLEDSGGRLWIGTEGGGISCYQQHRFELRFAAADSREVIHSIVETADGSIWFLGNDLRQFKGGNLISHELTGEGARPSSMATRDGDVLWVCQSKFVERRQNSEIQLFRQDPGNQIQRMVFGQSGSVWGIGRQLLFRFDGERFVRENSHEGGRPLGTFVDSHSRSFVGTGKHVLLLHEPPDGPAWLQSLPWSTDVGVRSILEDREGNLWLGTRGGGLTQLQPMPFRLMGKRFGLPLEAVWYLDADETGLCVVFANAVTYRWDRGQPQAELLVEGQFDHGIAAVCMSEGDLYRVRGPWLFRLRDGEQESWRHGLPLPVARICRKSGGGLWITAPGALARFDGTEVHQAEVPELEQENTSPLLVEDSSGTLWLVTPAGVRRTGDSPAFFPAPAGMLVGEMRGILLSANGSLWIGTYGGGLIRFRNGEYSAITKDLGLPDNVVSNIQEDDKGNLWLNTNHGVVSAHLKDLEAVADGSVRRLQCRTYPTGEANGPSGARLANGWMWLPTLKGVISIDPSFVLPNLIEPSIHIESVVAGDERLDPGEMLTVAPDRRDLKFGFTATCFREPAAVRFLFQLEGYDPDWREGDPSRSATYTNIPAGTYRFRVRAFNEDGREGREASVQLELQYFFYETIWFKLLVGSSILVLGLTWHRLRVSRVRRHNEQLQEEVRSRREAEQAWKESREEYRALVETASDAIVTIGEDHRVLYANPASAALFNASQQELVGLPLASILPDLAERLSATNGDTDPGFLGIEYLARSLDGTSTPVEASVAVFVAPGGIRGLMAVLRDVSERKIAEKERDGLQHRLREAERLEAVGRLAGGISHDFNNILTAMCGCAELIELEARDRLTATELEYLEDILRCGERAATLTRQLLAFSRQQVMKPEVLDPCEVLRGLTPMLERLIPANVELEFHLSPDSGSVRVDRSKLEQVVVNLVLNARDAMPDGGKLSVSTGCDHGAGSANNGSFPACPVQISVRDTGVGIDEETLPKVFEPFFTTKEFGKGTGLGLASVHGIVAQFGGSIDVDSKLGLGTVFHVHLPLAEEDSPPVGMPRRETPRLTGRETVLVCDDEDSVGRVIQEMLEQAGYAALLAGDPEEAVLLCQRHSDPIHLLITDVVMPGMTGPRLAERIRALRPEVTVLFVSGYSSELVFRLGADHQETPILHKPFSRSELLTKVRGLLDRADADADAVV